MLNPTGISNLLNNNLRATLKAKMHEKVLEMIANKNSSIDLSKVDVSIDMQTGKVSVDSNDSETKEKLERMYSESK